YQEGAIVDEDDIEHNDDDLLDENFYGTATTSISDLNSDTQYTFNIYAYDDYGNVTAAAPLTEKTNAPPTGIFNSAAQKIDGSGVVQISIEVYDINGDLAQAKLEYEAGDTCQFLSSDPLYLDSNPANISADHGTPEIDNNSEYQVGSSSRIITSSGSNTINFDWLSKQDVPAASGIYCLRLTVFDGADTQIISATTTLEVDNTVPDAPGDLTAESVSSMSVTLAFGAAGTDDYFEEYKIFYKQGTSGVSETDSEFNQNNDASLGDENYLSNGSTTVSGLIQDMDYVFNIWIYDDYGNVASATNEMSTSTAFIPSATWREDEDTPVPSSSTPPSEFENIRVRIAVANSGDWAASNTKYNLEYGIKNGTCAAAASWTTVPATATTEHFEMVESIYFDDKASTTERLINAEEYTFVAGYLLEDPSNQTGSISLSGNRYTEIEYNIAGTVQVSNSATYCFRVTDEGEVLDEYSEYAELQMAPPPEGDFNSAVLRVDGSGVVDISIEVSDTTGDPSKAKIEYATGTACVFSPSDDPTLDTNSANISDEYGDVVIDNNSVYQVGTSSGYIITEFGSNTIEFDWLSLSDLSGADGEYCLQLTVNDSYNDQAIPATTTLYIDAANPSTPGDLSLESKTINSVTLAFGATSSDSNFKEYRIYYRQAASGVTESDELHSSSTDENLGFSNFKGATTTTISDLIQNQQYVFKIWAYDQYGNKAASFGEISTRLVPTISGVVYQVDGVTPDTNGYNLNFVVNGSVEETTNASVINGRFTFQDIQPPATGTPILIYINNVDERGVMYNRFGGAGEINDFHIYINRVVVRHDDDGPLAVANIDTYDKDQDADIPVTVSGISITLDNGFDFYVWPGDTFEAGSGDVDLYNLEIDGVFTAVGEQNITVNGSWDGSSGSFEAASSTVEFISTTSGNFIRTNDSPFYNLTFNGSGGEWTLVGHASSTATTTIMAGTLIHGGDNNFEIDSLFIASSSNFIKATGTGLLIFEDDGVGYFEDLNASKNNLGNVQIGYSPATTRLNSDFVADSLTINSGDIFDTRGFEVTITNFITVNGTYDCTDDKEGDGTITTLGTNWTVASGGTFTADTSTTTFNGTSTSTINTGGTDVDHDFNILTLAKSSTATVTLASYDMRVSSDVIIGANSILDVSTSNYEIYAGGSWENSGSFIARAATTTFEAASTGHTINPGNSSFYDIEFNNSSGGWSIINNATTSNKWLITAAQALTINSGVFIEVQGEFKNLVGGTATTWIGSTLYLNNAQNNTINTKTGDSDTYATLFIGPNTDIKMWDSSSSAYTVDSSSSLYSMDHSDIPGSLYIWGDYRVDNNAQEYWSYATDFDGTDISGAPRQCKVYLANNASTTIDYGSLNIVGILAASTTIANQGSGNYGINIASGTINASYYEFRNLNSQGLIISGPSVVNSLSYGDFEIGVNSGVAMSVNSSVINENPELSITNCRFATSSSITASANVKLGGTPTSAWFFSAHYGNYAGESFDSDSGDPRGYIIWDDSPSYTPKSQDWRWFHDQDSLTPLAGAVATNTAPLTIGVNNNLKLRITINETSGISGENVKLRLQFSTSSDFSENIYYVGEIGSSTAWVYSNGAGNDNEIISTRIHSDATANATHNESGISYSAYDHNLSTPAEWEFTIYNNNAATNTVYYFRPFATYYDIYSTSSKAVIYNGSEGYANLMVSDASLSLTVSGVVSNTVIDNITTDFSTTPGQVAFGDLTIGAEFEGAHNFTITTNAEFGYQLFIYQRQDLISDVGSAIDPISTTNLNPGAWTINPNPSGFGYHTTDDTLSDIGLGSSRFSAFNTYAQFNSSPEEISYSSIPVANENVDFVYKVQAENLQEAGDYVTEVVYVIVPTY
ncbi:fibronectin type III domain-containing protein, partial [Candidatus Parcubacteria bacterium]|nr:fibronectin type III domain-containing protein [Candidatus Parcubacteria bacterium]